MIECDLENGRPELSSASQGGKNSLASYEVTRETEKPGNGAQNVRSISLEFQESLLPWWGSKQNQTNTHKHNTR